MPRLKFGKCVLIFSALLCYFGNALPQDAAEDVCSSMREFRVEAAKHEVPPLTGSGVTIAPAGTLLKRGLQYMTFNKELKIAFWY
jgi:hypothetical protein